MQNMEPVTNENFLIFAARHYDNPTCLNTDEFLEDIMRLKYLKKLTTRFLSDGELKERLILNHLIVLSNVFRPEILCKIMWLKMDKDSLTILKPFLILLNILPDKLYNVNGNEVINTDEIPLNQVVVAALRKI